MIISKKINWNNLWRQFQNKAKIKGQKREKNGEKKRKKRECKKKKKNNLLHCFYEGEWVEIPTVLDNPMITYII